MSEHRAKGGALGRRGLMRLAGVTSVAGLGAACGPLERGPAVDAGDAARASVLGIPNERFLPAQGIEPFEREFLAAMERNRVRRGIANVSRRALGLNLLAISGGGEDGAFGAGLLNGWTARGDRPEFDVVTGVSTGALSAPFAFLGPAYDAQLKAVYTSVEPKDILESRGLVQAMFDDAMADNTPLFRMISRYLDAKMLRDIAAAYQDGRMLLIGTTNLDQQQPVVWNIGAIAASGHPKAMETIHRILLASAAVPAAFPPVMFDVTVDGQPRQEMHVDGGAVAQVFLYPPALARTRQARMRRGEDIARITSYIIRNGRLDPGWQPVKRKIFSIAGRAISTMIATSGVNDVQRIYFNTQRDGIGFNLAAIGRDFTDEAPEPFDQAYMRKLYDYAYRLAQAGYRWEKAPAQIRALTER